MAIGYTEIDFVNGSAPALNATNLNKIDEALKDACDILDAETVAGRALVEAANADAQRTLLNVEDGADVTDATNVQAALTADASGGRSALGLGDSATLDVGTGAGDVAAGNAPAGAVTAHESTYAHANLPTADEKTRLGDIQGASGATTALKLANLTSPATTTQQGVALLAADGGTTAATVVQANDSRLQSAPATWTPVPKFGGVNDDGTFVISQNRMTRAGKKYTYDARIVWSAKGTKTGEFSMSGIAQAAATSGVPAGWISCDAGMLGLTSGDAIISVVTTLNITFRKHISGGLNIALTDENFTNASDIRIHIEFIAS